MGAFFLLEWEDFGISNNRPLIQSNTIIEAVSVQLIFVCSSYPNCRLSRYLLSFGHFYFLYSNGKATLELI